MNFLDVFQIMITWLPLKEQLKFMGLCKYNYENLKIIRLIETDKNFIIGDDILKQPKYDGLVEIRFFPFDTKMLNRPIKITHLKHLKILAAPYLPMMIINLIEQLEKDMGEGRQTIKLTELDIRYCRDVRINNPNFAIETLSKFNCAYSNIINISGFRNLTELTTNKNIKCVDFLKKLTKLRVHVNSLVNINLPSLTNLICESVLSVTHPENITILRVVKLPTNFNEMVNVICLTIETNNVTIDISHIERLTSLSIINTYKDARVVGIDKIPCLTKLYLENTRIVYDLKLNVNLKVLHVIESEFPINLEIKFLRELIVKSISHTLNVSKMAFLKKIFLDSKFKCLEEMSTKYVDIKDSTTLKCVEAYFKSHLKLSSIMQLKNLGVMLDYDLLFNKDKTNIEPLDEDVSVFKKN